MLKKTRNSDELDFARTRILALEQELEGREISVCRLTARLEIFQRQNEENCRLAESEISRLREELRRSEISAAQTTGLAQEKEEISDQLATAKEHLALINSVLEISDHESILSKIRRLVRHDHLEISAASFRENFLLCRVFGNFRVCVARHKKLRQISDLHRPSLTPEIFRAWRKFAGRQISAHNARARNFRFKQLLEAWRLGTAEERPWRAVTRKFLVWRSVENFRVWKFLAERRISARARARNFRSLAKSLRLAEISRQAEIFRGTGAAEISVRRGRVGNFFGAWLAETQDARERRLGRERLKTRKFIEQISVCFGRWRRNFRCAHGVRTFAAPISRFLVRHETTWKKEAIKIFFARFFRDRKFVLEEVISRWRLRVGEKRRTAELEKKISDFQNISDRLSLGSSLAALSAHAEARKISTQVFAAFQQRKKFRHCMHAFFRWLGAAGVGARSEMAALRRRTADLEISCEETEETKARLEREWTTMRQNLRESEIACDAEMKKTSELTRELARLEKTKAEIERKSEEAEISSRRVNEELGRVKGELFGATERATAAETKLSHSEISTRERLERLEKELTEKETVVMWWRAKHDEWLDEKSQVESEIRTLKSERDRMATEVDRLKERLRLSLEREEKAAGELGNFILDQDRSSTEVQKLLQEIADRDKELSVLRMEISQLERAKLFQSQTGDLASERPATSGGHFYRPFTAGSFTYRSPSVRPRTSSLVRSPAPPVVVKSSRSGLMAELDALEREVAQCLGPRSAQQRGGPLSSGDGLLEKLDEIDEHLSSQLGVSV